MSAPSSSWRSVTSEALLLSLRAPRTWEARAIDDPRLELVRDEPDRNAWRSKLELRGGEPEEAGMPWFSQLCEGLVDGLAQVLPEFEPLDTEAYRLSCHARVYSVTFRQHAKGAPPTSHLQAFVWANSYRMFMLDGVTPREHEERDLPVMGEVLRSLRVLPRRP